MDEPADEALSTPRAVMVAAAIVWVEATALAALGVAALVNADRQTLGLGMTNAAFFLLYAAGLGFAGLAFRRLRSWSRAPIILAQMIQLGVAWSFYGNDTIWLALVLGVLAVVVVVIAIAPGTTTALYADRESDIP